MANVVAVKQALVSRVNAQLKKVVAKHPLLLKEVPDVFAWLQEDRQEVLLVVKRPLVFLLREQRNGLFHLNFGNRPLVFHWFRL